MRGVAVRLKCTARSEWLAKMETTVNDLTEVFEETKSVWLSIFQEFDRRAVERARLDKPDEGVGEAIIRIAEPNETSKKKATRHRDAFIKYNEGGKVDIDGLEQVFVDMKLTVPDSEDLQETIEHYSNGGEGVNHEQFSELLDLLESDEGYKLRKVYDKYIMRLWSVKGGDRRKTLNGEALGLLLVIYGWSTTLRPRKSRRCMFDGELSLSSFSHGGVAEGLAGKERGRCSLRSFTKEDTVPYVKLLARRIVDTGKIRSPCTCEPNTPSRSLRARCLKCQGAVRGFRPTGLRSVYDVERVRGTKLNMMPFWPCWNHYRQCMRCRRSTDASGVSWTRSARSWARFATSATVSYRRHPTYSWWTSSWIQLMRKSTGSSG